MKKRFLVSFIVGMLLVAGAYAQTVVYVDKDATGSPENGSSWAQAYRTLQAGIDAAAAVGTAGNPAQVWVSEGNYGEIRALVWGFPAEATGSLILRSNVHVFGGFRGVETALAQRLPGQYQALIDGRTSRGGVNAYHVVVAGSDVGPITNSVLDGFSIYGGRASGVSGDYHSWRGAGLFNYLSSPTIANCTFYDNTAAVAGGAIANESNATNVATPLIRDCVFRGNAAQAAADSFSNPIRGGGAIFNNGGGNSTVEYGCLPDILNCTFFNNSCSAYPTAPYTGMIFGMSVMNFNCTADEPDIKNCILWNNPTTTNQQVYTMRPSYNPNPGTQPTFYADLDYCDIQNGYTGATGILTADPLFRNEGNSDFRLYVSVSPTSPCVDAGSNSEVVPPIGAGRTDIRAAARLNGANVDMGAYENIAPPIAAFSGTPTDGISGMNVQFTDLSNTFGKWNETAWAWNFGDPGSGSANTNSDQNPTHTFNTVGRYSITLTVQTAEGSDPETKTDYITVHSLPTAAFSASVTQGVGTTTTPLSVTFTDASVADTLSPTTVTITDWWWDFDGNGTDDAHYTTPTNPTHVYTTPGFYTVSLRVRTSLGNDDTETKTNYLDVWPDPLSVTPVTIIENSGGTPNDGNIDMGHDVSFQVTASNGYPGYTYVWQLSVSGPGGPWNTLTNGTFTKNVNGSDGVGSTAVQVTIANAGTDTLSITRAVDPFYTGLYRCIVTDSGTAPPPTSVTAASAMLTIDGGQLFFLQHPQGAQKYTLDGHAFSVRFIGGSGTDYFYSWFRGTPPEQVGPNSKDYTLPSIDRTTADTYFCFVFNNAGSYDNERSNDAVLDVMDPVNINNDPDTIHRNVGGNASFTVGLADFSGYAPFTYKWYFNGTTLLADGAHPSGSGAVVSNADKATIDIANLGLADAGNYHCVVVDSLNTGSKSTDTSSAAALTVTVQLAITDPAPAVANRYVGESATLSATASGGDGSYTFQWQRDIGSGYVNVNNGDLGGRAVVGGSGATSTLTVDGMILGDTGSYRCFVSDPTSLDPDAYPVLASQISVFDNLTNDDPAAPIDKTDNVGNTVTFTTVPAGGLPTLSYSWEYSPTGAAGTWVALTDGAHTGDATSTISGQGSATLSLTLGSNAHLTIHNSYYHCVVKDGGLPTAQTYTSRDAKLQVTNFLNVVGPEDVRAYTDEAGVILTANVFAGTPPYSYNWMKGGVSISGGFIAGQNTLDLGTADSGDVGIYSVVVRDSSGINPDVTSRDATVAVANPPSITQNPANKNIYAGQSARFDVTMTGGFEPYAYDWRLVGSGSLGAPNQNFLLLNAVPITFSGNQYMVNVSDAGSTVSGSNYTRASGIATLLVGESTFQFDKQPQGVQAYVDDPTFYLSVEVSGGLQPYNYDWKRIPAGGTLESLGNNTPALLVDPSAVAPNTYAYHVDVTDGIPTEYPSDDAMVQVANHLAFDQDLEGEYEATSNNDFSIGVIVTEKTGLGTPTYAWTRNVGGKAWETIMGEDGPVLEFSPITEEDSGQYQVTVTDTGSSLTGESDSLESTIATITVTKGVPAASLMGLAALSALTALGGAMKIRRRK